MPAAPTPTLAELFAGGVRPRCYVASQPARLLEAFIVLSGGFVAGSWTSSSPGWRGCAPPDG